MTIKRSSSFKKQFKKLPPYVLPKFEERLVLLIQNPNNPILNNHKLSGKYAKSRSINITGDYRLVFTNIDESLYLDAIGTHSELYN